MNQIQKVKFMSWLCTEKGIETPTKNKQYRHIRNYYRSNSKTFQDGNGNGNCGEINSNDFQDGNWESMEMKG